MRSKPRLKSTREPRKARGGRTLSGESVVLFLASPGDMTEERKVVCRVIKALNARLLRAGKPKIRVVAWPDDIAAGAGPYLQSVINRQAAEYDIFVCLIGARLGTETPNALSGSEEEFDAAVERFRTEGRVQLLLFFSNRRVPLADIDPHQLLLVRYFREKVERLGVLAHTHSDMKEFQDLFKTSIVGAYEQLSRPRAHVERSIGQVATGPATQVMELGSIHLRTRLVNPQRVDYYVVPLVPNRRAHLTLCGLLRVACPYFRFGFKYGDSREPLVSAGGVQTFGQNIVVHVGKNVDNDSWFMTYYQSGLRIGSDLPLPQLNTTPPMAFALSVDSNKSISLRLNDDIIFERLFVIDGTPRIAVMAWGDEHEFQCDVEQLKLLVRSEEPVRP
jgi:hypothetical protein